MAESSCMEYVSSYTHKLHGIHSYTASALYIQIIIALSSEWEIAQERVVLVGSCRVLVHEIHVKFLNNYS